MAVVGYGQNRSSIWSICNFVGRFAFKSSGVVGGNGEVIGKAFKQAGNGVRGTKADVSLRGVSTRSEAIMNEVSSEVGFVIRLPCQGDGALSPSTLGNSEYQKTHTAKAETP